MSYNPEIESDEPIRSSRSIQTPYGEQDENGVDLSLIRTCLKMTPEERLLNGDAARQSALILREYGRQHREKLAEANR